MIERVRLHEGLTPEQWHAMTLMEQMANIGSEVARAIRAKENDKPDRMWGAIERSLELFELTIADPRLRHRLKEITRVREVVLDFLVGENEYSSTGADLDRYFLAYAFAARRTVGASSTVS